MIAVAICLCMYYLIPSNAVNDMVTKQSGISTDDQDDISSILLSKLLKPRAKRICNNCHCSYYNQSTDTPLLNL